MNRLLEAELIYGRLLTVNEPHLIARYNKALKGFGLPETRLAEFNIDMTGFSPEVAEELGDDDYLDPNKVNRRFIILTPEQESLPVVHTSFSNTAGLMHEFYSANARAISAVTIKDALYGEIEDSVATVDHIEDLLSINEVNFKVYSAEDILGKATELRALADRLASQPDAWRDDDLLNRMVELAKLTGDIRQNTLVPDQLVFRHDAFWASHFGGVYVFHDGRNSTVICKSTVPGFRKARPWQVSYIDSDDYETIYGFLARTKRIQLPQASWIQQSGLYQHRLQMILLGLAAKNDPAFEPGRADQVWLQTWANMNARLIADEGSYPVLSEMNRLVNATGQIRMKDIAPRYRFLLVRADPDHPDQWLVNRLISQMQPFDFVSRYIFDKQGFYDAYAAYSEKFREYVVKTLEDTYLRDKSAFRHRLFGITKD
jgi:glycosyltransferase involved in cell wall biosynthesis